MPKQQFRQLPRNGLQVSVRKCFDVLFLSFMLVALLSPKSFTIAVKEGMEHCEQCTYIISVSDTSTYMLTGGETFCVTQTGNFEGRLLRLSGSTKVKIINEGVFAPQNFILTTGIVHIDNYHSFCPEEYYVFPGVNDHKLNNAENAYFNPGVLFLLGKENHLHNRGQFVPQQTIAVSGQLTSDGLDKPLRIANDPFSKQSFHLTERIYAFSVPDQYGAKLFVNVPYALIGSINVYDQEGAETLNLPVSLHPGMNTISLPNKILPQKPYWMSFQDQNSFIHYPLICG